MHIQSIESYHTVKCWTIHFIRYVNIYTTELTIFSSIAVSYFFSLALKRNSFRISIEFDSIVNLVFVWGVNLSFWLLDSFSKSIQIHSHGNQFIYYYYSSIFISMHNLWNKSNNNNNKKYIQNQTRWIALLAFLCFNCKL